MQSWRKKTNSSGEILFRWGHTITFFFPDRAREVRVFLFVYDYYFFKYWFLRLFFQNQIISSKTSQPSPFEKK